MPGSERTYHLRRAEKQRLLADRSADPAVAKVHRLLAELHEQRAGGQDIVRRTLHMATPIT